jgi:hypothetical protein
VGSGLIVASLTQKRPIRFRCYRPGRVAEPGPDVCDVAMDRMPTESRRHGRRPGRRARAR